MTSAHIMEIEHRHAMMSTFNGAGVGRTFVKSTLTSSSASLGWGEDNALSLEEENPMINIKELTIQQLCSLRDAFGVLDNYGILGELDCRNIWCDVMDELDRRLTPLPEENKPWTGV